MSIFSFCNFMDIFVKYEKLDDVILLYDSETNNFIYKFHIKDARKKNIKIQRLVKRDFSK